MFNKTENMFSVPDHVWESGSVMGLIRVFRLSKVTLEYYMIPQHFLRSFGISWDISGHSGIGYSRILSSEIP